MRPLSSTSCIMECWYKAVTHSLKLRVGNNESNHECGGQLMDTGANCGGHGPKDSCLISVDELNLADVTGLAEKTIDSILMCLAATKVDSIGHGPVIFLLAQYFEGG